MATRPRIRRQGLELLKPPAVRSVAECTELADRDFPFRLRSFAVAALLAGIGVVTACAPPSLRDLAQGASGAVEAAAAVITPSRSAPRDPLLDFLASAEDGEVREFDDPSMGARLRVTAGRLYHSASGRPCRRYTAGSAAAAPDSHGRGLACEGANGDWARASLLAPASP